jgi:hypothetical protein
LRKIRNALSLLALTVLLLSTACTPQAKAPPPPSATAGADAPSALGEKNPAQITVSLSSTPYPPTMGLGTLEAKVSDAAGRAVTDAQVSFDLNMTNMNMGRSVVDAVSQGKGLYIGQVRYSMPGPWRVIVRIARPGQEPQEQRYDFAVKFR